jgi:hypothetical protein
MGVGRGDDDLVDQFGVGVDRQVGLVAVEAPVPGLVTVTGLGIDCGDHPVGGDPPGDPEQPPVAAAVVVVDVLARHDRQQLGGIRGWAFELGTVECLQRGLGVADQRVDELVTGVGVVPVTRGLARCRVVVVAAQPRTDPRRQRSVVAVEGSQQLADR